MNRPNKNDYPVSPMDEPIVEFKKYTDDLEKYADELERELALAKAEPFISVGIGTHNKMIAQRDAKIEYLQAQNKILTHTLKEKEKELSLAIKHMMDAGCCTQDLLSTCINCESGADCSNCLGLALKIEVQKELKGENNG